MDLYFSLLNLSFVENCHISIFTTFAKQSMINRLSNAINRNHSAAKISKVMSSIWDPFAHCLLSLSWLVKHTIAGFAPLPLPISSYLVDIIHHQCKVGGHHHPSSFIATGQGADKWGGRLKWSAGLQGMRHDSTTRGHFHFHWRERELDYI